MHNFLKSAAGAAIAVSIAGCATDVPMAQADPYAKLGFVGAPQLYEHDRVAGLERPRQTVGPAQTPLLAVAYGGVEGARAAHARYPHDVAEQLDGRCETFVKAGPGETLASMADLCDVDIAKLVAYNPGVENPYELPIGQSVKVPGADKLGQISGIGSLSGELIGLYEVSRGETISDVAARFDVSLATILDINPQARWRAPEMGELVRVPAEGVVAAAEAAKAGPAWQGYSASFDGSTPGDGVATADDAVTAFVESQMPFARSDDGPERRPSIAGTGVQVSTSATVVKAGGSVQVSLSGARPGERVTFYRGKTTSDSDANATVVAGPDGVATATFRIPTESSDLGGYVFSAVRESSSLAHFSERVAVLKL